MEGEVTQENQGIGQETVRPRGKGRLYAIVATVVAAVVIASILALSWSGVIQIGGVTLRELQLDFNNEDHDYRHYDEGNSVVMVDKISSLEVGEWAFGTYTRLEFSAKPLPDPDDVRGGSVHVEDWYTYVPDDYSRPLRTTFHDSINVKGDVSGEYSVGDKVRITLHFTSVEVPGVWGDEPFMTELIKETIGGITEDMMTKVG
jgi:hypothetical protein